MDSKVSLNIIKNWQSLCDDIVLIDILPSLLQNRIITVNEYQDITSMSDPPKLENFLLLLLKKNENVQMRFADSLEKHYSWLAEKIKDGCCKKIKEESRDETDAIPSMQTDSCKVFENDTTEDEKDMCLDYNNLNAIDRSNLNNRINVKGRNLDRRRVIRSRVKNRIKQKIQNCEPVISSTTELINPALNEEVTDEAITVIKNSSLVSKSWTTIAHSLGLTDRVHDIRFKVILHGEDLNMCVVYLIRQWLETFPKMATLSKLIEVLKSENFNRVAEQLKEIQFRKPVTTNSRVQ